MSLDFAPDDDDDWIDLEKPLAAGVLAPLSTVKLTKTTRNAKTGAARASVWLRRELADWARGNGPRFRLQIGGAGANLLRVIPDIERGRYETAEFRGAIRINLGVVNVWPDEDRPAAEAAATVTPGGLVLKLPADFARAAVRALPAPAKAAPPPALDPAPAPVVKRGPTAGEIARVSAEMKLAMGVTAGFPQDIGGQHFTPTEAAIVEALLKRVEMSRAGLLMATHDPAFGEDERSDKLIDVLICKIRPKLLALGLSIQTHGGCFLFDLPAKAKLRALLKDAGAEAAE